MRVECGFTLVRYHNSLVQHNCQWNSLLPNTAVLMLFLCGSGFGVYLWWFSLFLALHARQRLELY